MHYSRLRKGGSGYGLYRGEAARGRLPRGGKMGSGRVSLYGGGGRRVAVSTVALAVSTPAPVSSSVERNRFLENNLI